MALAIIALVVGSIYGVLILAIKRTEAAKVRATIQHEARVAIDRVARELREASFLSGRTVIYNTSCVGCAIGFSVARDSSGVFKVVTDPGSPNYGRPDWRGVVYLYFDGSALRRHIDMSTQTPAVSPSLPADGEVVLDRVQSAEFVALGTGRGKRIRVRLVAVDQRETTAIQTDVELKN